jgi:two-component system, LytTR family, response regulator
VKVMVVDQQSEARDNIARLCELNGGVHLVASIACGMDAVEAAYEMKPDLLMINTQLPDMCGFDLLRLTGARSYPSAIMISACVEHAIRAFAEGAIDYLLTPLTGARFDLAIAHARHRIAYITGRPPESENPTPLLRLVGERQRRLYPLDPKAIDYIEADANYVTLRAGKVEYVSRDSIKRLSPQLQRLGFVRVSRSLLVNAAAVAYAEAIGHRKFALTLSSGACLHSTAAYSEELLRLIPLPTLSKRYTGTAL